MPLELNSSAASLRLGDGGALTLTREGRPILTLLGAFISAYGVTIRATRITDSRVEGNSLHATFATDAPPLQVTLEASVESDGFRVVWSAPPPATTVGILVRLADGGPWYGMGERVIQGWPLEQYSVISEPFAPMDHGRDGTRNLAAPLWLNAAGVGLLVAEDTGDLAVRMNVDGDGVLRITQQSGQRLAANMEDVVAPVAPHLVLRLLVAETLPAAHRLALAHLGHPTTAPLRDLLVRPTWTSWARYKMHITQAGVIEFADDIIAHGYPYAVFEIDDRWQADYGDLEFDRAKFPDPRRMVAALHARGFKVTLWAPPFINPSSALFADAAARGYLLRHVATGQTALARWWQGHGGVVDLSSADARAWWLGGLRRLQEEYGVDGFKFDAGEGNFVPPYSVGAGHVTKTSYPDYYVDFVAQNFQWTEVRTGWRSQRHGVLFRECDKWSPWGPDNGLRAVLTQALTMGIIGYPFVLPDMIGGNAYGGEEPDGELMVRWTQLTALLPAMQFSLAPWDYGAQCDAICLRYARLHETLAPILDAAVAETLATGVPLVRPLFWATPDDRATYTIDDEFTLGDWLLVAPVLQPGQRERDVYLPAGRWRDTWTGAAYSGPTRLERYPAPLDTLPLFERR